MKICIDPGHGGSDPGAVAPDGTEEKAIAVRYGAFLMDELEHRGHEVIATRMTDITVSLRDRAGMANEAGADCLVSLHANASSNAAVNGAWVIYDDRSPESQGQRLAREIFYAMEAIPGVADSDAEEEVYPDRTAWVGNRNLAVISQARMPAVLVELGFLTNAEDLQQLLDPGTLADVVRAIADGIEAWASHGTIIDVEDPAGVPIQEHEIQIRVEKWLEMPVREVVAEASAEDEATIEFIRKVLSAACELPWVRKRLGWSRKIVCWAMRRLIDILA